MMKRIKYTNQNFPHFEWISKGREKLQMTLMVFIFFLFTSALNAQVSSQVCTSGCGTCYQIENIINLTDCELEFAWGYMYSLSCQIEPAVTVDPQSSVCSTSGCGIQSQCLQRTCCFEEYDCECPSYFVVFDPITGHDEDPWGKDPWNGNITNGNPEIYYNVIKCNGCIDSQNNPEGYVSAEVSVGTNGEVTFLFECQ